MLHCIFGFLRCSKFTVPQEHEYDPTVHLSYENVAVDCRRDLQIIQIHIKQSKTDSFRKGVKLSLRITDNAVCPVGVVLAYLAVRGSQPDALFLTEQSRLLMRQHFCSALTAILVNSRLIAS